MGIFTKFNLPPEMTKRDQWICWRNEMRDGKKTKVPVDPNTGEYGRSNDPSTWSDYETARDVSEDEDIGLGFVFHEDDPFVGIDLDDFRDPDAPEGEQMDKVAENIIVRMGSYTEISPSGTGYHIIVKGELPEGRNRRGGIEMYDHGRFFTVTGDRVDNTPYHVHENQRHLDIVHAKYLADRDEQTRDATPTQDLDMDDEEVIKKAKNAANGDQFERLWNGGIGGYDSHSEADLALCSFLAFWTGGDANQMDRLFKESGLMREKWDQVHSSNGDTYGEMTISKAINTCTDFYDG